MFELFLFDQLKYKYKYYIASNTYNMVDFCILSPTMN